MKNFRIRFVLSVMTTFSVLMAVTMANAAPVKFNQVVQVINAKPGKANTGNFSQLRLVGGDVSGDDKDGDESSGKNKTAAPPQDDRVIIETRSEIVEDDVCDCEQPQIVGKKFPYYALLGLAAVPLLFLIPRGKDKNTPTPTQTPPGSMSPTMTPTPNDMTPTPTPTMSPTPPETVPEPMTLLLFGTGLASIGLAARRKFGKKDSDEIE